MDWISCSSSLLRLKDEPKHSFNQLPLFVSHTLTSDRPFGRVGKQQFGLASGNNRAAARSLNVCPRRATYVLFAAPKFLVL